MEIDFNEITYLKDPDQLTLKADYQQFLLSLSGPTVIDITGKDTSTWRVITTLLHGNEPSGLIAIHRWLTCDGKLPIPETNFRIIVVSVEAASHFPILSHRYLSEGLDINRCFGSDLNHGYFQRAHLIKNVITEVKPEAVIDLHNTSGSGPAFAVSPVITPEGLSLTSFFCDTIILSGIHLGALMEQDFGCPIITVECGGANDEQAHQVAYQGLNQLASCISIHNYHQKSGVNIVYKPLRLQVKPDIELNFNDHDEGEEGVTLKTTIEQFNYGQVKKGQMLGWTDENGLGNLQLINDVNENVIDDYFAMRDNQLVCATNIRIFMATTKKDIAINDCLFYVVNLPNSE